MRTIWYMGAKTRLTEAIQEAIGAAAPGADSVLDLMSGTSAVSRALASDHRVVANDVQAYAAKIAEAYLVHPHGAERVAGLDLDRILGARFRENAEALLERLEPAVALEDAFLEAYGLEPQASEGPASPFEVGPVGSRALAKARRQVPADPKDRARAYRAFALRETPTFLEEREAQAAGPFRGAAELLSRARILARRAEPTAFPYHLTTSYYPNVYLGLRQAIAVDSLRYAIDGVTGRGARERKTHLLAALLHATSVTTSATSHFCQPRGLVRDAEVKAVLIRRSFSIPGRTAAFGRELAEAVAAAPLHPGNLVRSADWRGLYEREWEGLGGIDVVYADPPYTADNYSRFYHVLEVLTDYAYPELQVLRGRTTKGRYPVRTQRHQSPFCHKRSVERELADLCAETAARGAALVLSYGGENGLLLRAYRDGGASARSALRRFGDLARAAYGQVELRKERLLHSGQGDSNHEVTELLLVASQPRSVRASRRKCG